MDHERVTMAVFERVIDDAGFAEETAFQALNQLDAPAFQPVDILNREIVFGRAHLLTLLAEWPDRALQDLAAWPAAVNVHDVEVPGIVALTADDAQLQRRRRGL